MVALNHTLAVNRKLVKNDCDRVQIEMMKNTTSECQGSIFSFLSGVILH